MAELKQIEIPAGEWPEFVGEFSREHHGWLALVARIATAELEQRPEEAELRWQRISEPRHLQRLALEQINELTELLIDVGEGEAAIAVLVSPVTRIFRLRRNEEHQGLRADTGNGQSTLVWFRTAARPEVLDGITPEEL